MCDDRPSRVKRVDDVAERRIRVNEHGGEQLADADVSNPLGPLLTGGLFEGEVSDEEIFSKLSLVSRS